MVTKKQSSNKGRAPANLVTALAIVCLLILAITDLLQANDVPSFVYVGLIGASLGAKFDDIFGRRP
jgi:hypothetical protein